LWGREEEKKKININNIQAQGIESSKVTQENVCYAAVMKGGKPTVV
jgi:Ethanolamine utilization protein EutJ (predicted chaperonin)